MVDVDVAHTTQINDHDSLKDAPNKTPSRQASIELVDELIEANKIQELKKIPLEECDAARIISYLMALASTTSRPEQRTSMEKLCYELALTHGNLSTAMEIAILLDDTERMLKLIKLCVSPDEKPDPELMASVPTEPISRQGPSSLATSWPRSARLSWNPDDIEREAALRRSMLLQLCLMMARAHVNITVEDLPLNPESESQPFLTKNARPDAMFATSSMKEMIECILRRENVSMYFEYLQRELDVVEPRATSDILKSDGHEARKRVRAGASLDAGGIALATAYVSAFVHAGFLNDVYLSADSNAVIQKARHHSMTAATAAVGLLSLWNVSSGLTRIDKFQYSSDAHTRAGAMLAFGINSVNVDNDCDPVLNLVGDTLNAADLSERLAAYTALGYAYVGSRREEVMNLLVPVVLDLETIGGIEASAAAAFALGMVFVGSGEPAVTEALIQTMLERAEVENAIDSVHAYQFAVALALVHIKKREQAAVVVETVRAINHPLGSLAAILTEACAYAASNDLVKYQDFVHMCVDEVEKIHKTDSGEIQTTNKEADNGAAAAAKTDAAEKPLGQAEEEQKPFTVTEILEGASAPVAPAPTSASPPVTEAAAAAPAENVPTMDGGEANSRTTVAKLAAEDISSALPGAAILALPLILLGDDVGGDMLHRLFKSVLQFDGLFMRRAVPLALALHSTSNPRPHLVEMLSKLSHDADADTALHAILALGIVAAGTNNGRVAQLLRKLAHFYSVDANALFLVRLSQGLLHCGKGLHSLSPLYSDRKLIDLPALAGVFAFCAQALFTKETLCQGRYHMNLFHLVPAIHPRWLITVDENMEPIPVPVRVGHAVETAGLPGQPRGITGFRTHDTPVIIPYDETVEIGTSEWQPLSNTLEGIVVLRRLSGREKAQAARALE